MPVFFYRTGKGEERRKSISLSNISWNGQPRGGDVFISSALKPLPGWTGSGCFPEQRHCGPGAGHYV